jgi:hypothetical protein
VFANRSNEYAAVKNLIRATGIMEYQDADRMEEISIISLSKLIEGGAAMFAALNRNHHIDMIGAKHISPFERNMLRVWVIS